MNSFPSEPESRNDGPLTYEPEFAYYDGDTQNETSDDLTDETSFAGLPSLDQLDESPEFPSLDEDLTEAEEPDLGAPQEIEGSSEGMSFDDGFSNGLEDLGDFADFGDSEPDDAESEDDPEDDELLEGLDDSPSAPDASDSEDEVDSNAAPDESSEDEDDDDSSSLGELAKNAGAGLGAGLTKGLAGSRKILSGLPVIGKFITTAARAGIALALIVAVPIAIILVSSAIVRASTAPAETATVSLPDNGSVEMSKMVLSDDGKTLTATLKNTGDVIADVTPAATLKAVELSSPTSWYMRTDVGTCEGEKMTLDIEASKDITLSCTTSDSNAVVEGTLK